jgi:transcriptional regulator of arginine metabolism
VLMICRDPAGGAAVARRFTDLAGPAPKENP